MAHFSPSGAALAQVSPDGRLLVWDTASGALKQQFSPASHLAAAVACARWRPTVDEEEKDDKANKK